MSRAAAAFAAAALLSNAPAEAHESHRHRAAIPSRSGIAAADEAQSRHDFAAARSELDRLLAADPRDLEARLMSANLRLLAGEFDGARADYQRVLETGALYVGTICLASTQTGRNSVQRGRAMIAALGGGHPVILAPPLRDGQADDVDATYDPDIVIDTDRVPGHRVNVRRATSTHTLHPELALMLSTSGSTGSPKLVRLTHSGLRSNAAAIATYLHLTGQDRGILTLPLHYCYGLSILTSHLYAGAACVVS